MTIDKLVVGLLKGKKSKSSGFSGSYKTMQREIAEWVGILKYTVVNVDQKELE